MSIPIKTIVSPLVFTAGYIAKSGVNLVVGDLKKPVLGFSVHECETTAKMISRAEVLERAFATYDNYSEDFYEGHRWLNSADKKLFPAKDILLGGGEYVDASGLAFHTEQHAAEQHAVFELIERNYLASLWYGTTLLAKINYDDGINEEYTITYYTLHSEIQIPFVIAIIENKDQNIWLCGSSFKENILCAMRSAKREALMALHGILDESNEYCYSKETMARLLSLKDLVQSQARKKFFELNIKSQVDFKQNNFCAKSYFANDFYVIKLYEGTEGIVVRAVNDKLLKIRNIRAMNKNFSQISDPFC